MDTLPPADVRWSSVVNRHFEVIRLEELNRREQPDNHDPWQPHRLHFHALILFTRGEGVHGVDFVEHPVKAGTLIHVGANQIHHFGRTQELGAFMVVFLPAALPTNLLGLSTNSELSWSTVQYIWPSVTTLNAAQARSLQQHIELLETHPTPNTATQYLLWSIISLAAQFAVDAAQMPPSQTVDPRFLEFVDLLERSFESCRNVQWYAKRLNCSARTLYRLCMAAVGKSPKVITNERVAVEAQRRLLWGDTTVREVGYSLGFEETTNFIKFFRRLVGQNPDEFRRGVQQFAQRGG